MIKVQNNIPTREALPAFLQGLQVESLADLSWTDPALGVSDCKWLPEVDTSPALGAYERYEGETLALVGGVVHVTRIVVPWSAEEIEAERKASIPASVSPRQIRQALTQAGLRSVVEASIAGGDQNAKDWYEYATAFERTNPVVLGMAQALSITERQLDDLWTLAGSL